MPHVIIRRILMLSPLSRGISRCTAVLCKTEFRYAILSKTWICMMIVFRVTELM